MSLTTAVAVTFTLNTVTDSTPPYNVSGIQGIVSYDDKGNSAFNTWSAENVGTPQPAGAPFSIGVTDLGWSSSNQTGIANWALTFIPRGATNGASPFGNNQNTITGNGATGSNGNFTLNFSGGNPKIKNAGSWDWALMVQMTMPGGAIHCFASDPEMDVTS